MLNQAWRRRFMGGCFFSAMVSIIFNVLKVPNDFKELKQISPHNFVRRYLLVETLLFRVTYAAGFADNGDFHLTRVKKVPP